MFVRTRSSNLDAVQICVLFWQPKTVGAVVGADVDAFLARYGGAKP